MIIAPRHKRSYLLREIGESKIDMGLLEPMSQQALDMSLYMAVVDDDHRAVLAMRGTGANPDTLADGKLGEPTGTLLHYAARHSSLKTVIALMSLGADPQAKDGDGRTARQAASDRPSGNRMRTVLALWEKKKMSPAPEMEADFELVEAAIAS